MNVSNTLKSKIEERAKRDGFEITWEQFNVKEMKLAARELRQKANELEYLVEKQEEKEDSIE